MCGTSEMRMRSSPTVVASKRSRPTSTRSGTGTASYCVDLEDGGGSSSSSSSSSSEASSPAIVRRSLHFAAHASDDYDSSSDDVFVENGGDYDYIGDAQLRAHTTAGRSVTFSPNDQTYIIPMRRRKRRASSRKRRGRKNAPTRTLFGLEPRWTPVLVQVVGTVLVLAMVGYYRSRSGTGDAILPGGFQQRYQRMRSVLAQRSRRLASTEEPSTATESSATAQSSSSIRVFALPDTLRIELEKELLRPEVTVDVTDLQSLEAFIFQVKDIVGSHLSTWDPSVLETLQSLALPSTSGGTAAVLFRNLPLDPYVPPTPTDGSTTLHKSTFVAEAMLLAIGELSGASVVGYASETQYSNPWVHEGFPYPQQQRGGGRNGEATDGRSTTATTTGSALTMPKGMSHHQDMSYHPHPPDLLGLYCLREGHDKTLQTTIILNQDVTDRLPSDALRVLMENRFQIHASAWVDGFDTGHVGRSIISPISAATSTDNDDGGGNLPDLSIALPVDWTNMIGLDKEASAALEALGVAINAVPQHPIHFVEGDLLLFNNRRVVHARSDYNDLRLDGGDRVVDRAYFRRDWPSEEARRTRMI